MYWAPRLKVQSPRSVCNLNIKRPGIEESRPAVRRFYGSRPSNKDSRPTLMSVQKHTLLKWQWMGRFGVRIRPAM